VVDYTPTRCYNSYIEYRNTLNNTGDHNMNKHTLPTGTYYIGDLGYVMHKDWSEFCNKSFVKERNPFDVVTLDNKTSVLSHSTAYGDGEYYDQYFNEYSVDTGLIGAIAVKDIDQKDLVNLNLGHTFTFSGPVEMDYYDGRIVFTDGAITVEIDTDNVPNNGEYDEDEE
jgi:hypothetical protein